MKYLGYLTIALLFMTACDKAKIIDDKKKTMVDGEYSERSNKSVLSSAYKLFDMANQEAGPNKNVIISPLSIQYALGMAQNGAKENSLKELLAMYDLTIDDLPALNEHLAFLYHHLATQQEKLSVSISNAVFYDQEKVSIYPSYFDVLGKYFEPNMSSLNFKDQETALATINGWVNDVTHQKIIKVLDQISIDEFMFLINAIYMKADWDSPFPAEQTQEGVFTTSGQESVTVPFVSNRLNAFHLDDPSYQAFDLPLGQGRLGAVFICPKIENIESYIHQSIQPEFVASVISRMTYGDVILSLPKLEAKQHFDLKPILNKMGIVRSFSPQADFSGIAGNPGDVYLTRALHDVYLKMDENGVEGAAVTTVGVGVTSMPLSIVLNKPYLFIIYDKETKTHLFMGKIINPALKD